jgi:hypothetical protein
MKRDLICYFFAIFLAIVPSVAFAQQRTLNAGALFLSGYQATCGPIQTVVSPINDIAESWGGWIYVSPRLFGLPRAQQIFWYTHECGHQIFGSSEVVADCWAVQQGKVQGWLDAIDLKYLLDMVRRLAGDATHAAGQVRAENMQRCY